jgi:hypothetical protein
MNEVDPLEYPKIYWFGYFIGTIRDVE